MEQKRRRQTLERAKMNHLSKQLQMRLQYARLKVEHGWQRQNLNEVENLYFHNSHLRSFRPSAGTAKPQIANATSPGGSMADDPASVHQANTPTIPDRPSGSSPHLSHSLMIDNTAAPSRPTTSVTLTSSVQLIPSEQSQKGDTIAQLSTAQPPSSSSPEPYPDTASTLQNLSEMMQTPPALQANSTTRPPFTLDLSDPAILARLAQLQAQALGFSQGQSPQTQTQGQPLSLSYQSPTSTALQTGSNHASLFPATSASRPAFSFQPQFATAMTTTPPFSTSSAPMPSAAPVSAVTLPLQLPPSTQFLTPAALSLFSSTTAMTSAPIPASTATSTPQPPQPTSSSVSSTATAPTLTPAHGLTYDSFWSSHISAVGSTRALYRTHTGFSASANPAGHVAMLTPGGHAAVMTADGVYVAGGAVAKAGG
ncbi:hypothetical protein J3A83DRAFT_2915444 [Scleroderma citrinum]